MTNLTIWKETRLVNGEVAFTFPYPAQVLHMACETPNTLTVWAEVDPSREGVTHRYFIVGTGHPIPAGGIYVKTLIARPFVWHVYAQAAQR